VDPAGGALGSYFIAADGMGIGNAKAILLLQRIQKFIFLMAL
jgi:hypothetical protein